MELAKRYQTVIAQDPSQAQLAEAEQREGIRYEVANAEVTQQPDESVDLVTCAQAMHWCGFAGYGCVRQCAKHARMRVKAIQNRMTLHWYCLVQPSTCCSFR